MNDCPKYLHQHLHPIPNLTGFLISPSDGRQMDGGGLILETNNHGIWDPDSGQPQRKYMQFFHSWFRLPRELIGYGCYRGSKFCLALVFCLGVFLFDFLFVWVFLFPIRSFFPPSSHLCWFSAYLLIPALVQQEQIIPPVGLSWESNLRTRMCWVGNLGCYWQPLKWLAGMLALFFLHHGRISRRLPWRGITNLNYLLKGF